MALVSIHFGLSDSLNVILYRFKYNIYGKVTIMRFYLLIPVYAKFPFFWNNIDHEPNHLQDTSAKPTYQRASLKLLLRSKANNETIVNF